MRRTDAEMQQKIEVLIQDEADPRERARLLILYQIATVLIDNVAAVRETTEEFKQHRIEYEAHITREESFINQGRGMWRIAGAVLISAQAALGFLYTQHIDAMRRVEAIVTAQSKDIDALKTWKQFEDRNRGGMK